MEPNTKIIGLVGLLASGKGTIATYLKDKHSAATYRYSTMLRDVLTRMHLEISRNNMQEISRILRKTFGEDLIAKVITADVMAEKNHLIIVDGIRRKIDIKYLQDLPNFYLISVEAPEKIRWQRMNLRKENVDDGKVTFEEFKKYEKAEAEKEIPAVMKQAQFTIDNSSDDYNLAYQQIDKILKQINENKS